MRRVPRIALGLLVFAASTAAVAAEPVDSSLLEGRWVLKGTKIDQRGRVLDVPKEQLAETVMVITGKCYRLEHGARIGEIGSFGFDKADVPVPAGTTAKPIDIGTIEDLEVMPGLYETDGRTLKICFTVPPGKVRPEVLEVAAGSARVLQTFVREGTELLQTDEGRFHTGITR